MQHELPYSSSSAPAASAGPRLSLPARLAQRVSLRPVLLFSSLFSAIYLFLVAASSFRRADDTQTTENGLYTREIVPAILFLVAAAIEVLGFAGAITVSCTARARWTRDAGRCFVLAHLASAFSHPSDADLCWLQQRLVLARAYAYASLGGWAAIAAAQLYTIVTHYTMKANVINAVSGGPPHARRALYVWSAC